MFGLERDLHIYSSLSHKNSLLIYHFWHKWCQQWSNFSLIFWNQILQFKLFTFFFCSVCLYCHKGNYDLLYFYQFVIKPNWWCGVCGVLTSTTWRKKITLVVFCLFNGEFNIFVHRKCTSIIYYLKYEEKLHFHFLYSCVVRQRAV